MVGVAVGTLALIVVLSVFNGMEDLTVKLYSAYHPQIQMVAKRGKSFVFSDSMANQIKQIPDLKEVTEVIEDNALLRYDNAQMAVNVKGVSNNFDQQYDLRSRLISGEFKLIEGNKMFALLGFGVQSLLSISLKTDFTPLIFWYPRKQKEIELDPSKAFIQEQIMPVGVLGVDQQFDNNHVLVPLEFANRLMQYGNKRTSLEIACTNPNVVGEVQKQLMDLFGNDFYIKNIEEQQAQVLRAVKIERLFVYLVFSMILGIASFNIFFSLAMLVIEKKKDIAILQSFGASKNLLRKIFLFEGGLIAFVGCTLGLLMGLAFLLVVSHFQQEYGFAGFGSEINIFLAYPVKIIWTDFVYVCLIMLLITIAAAVVPAKNATKINMNEHL